MTENRSIKFEAEVSSNSALAMMLKRKTSKKVSAPVKAPAPVHHDIGSIKVDPSLKADYFVNATGRTLDSFGYGTFQAAMMVGRVVSERPDQMTLATTPVELYNSAIMMANRIAHKYPKSTVLVQSDFGYSVALASALYARGCKSVYVRTKSFTRAEVYAGKHNEYQSFVEYGFGKLKRTLSQPKPVKADSVILNFTSHPVSMWPADQITATHIGVDHIIDVPIKINTTLSAEKLRESVAAQVEKALEAYPTAFAAVIQGEWTAVTTAVPILIRDNVRPLYGVADRNAMLAAGTKKYIFGGFREYMVCGR